MASQPDTDAEDSDEPEPEIPTPSAIGQQGLAWSKGLDKDGGVGEMRIGASWGYLQLHAQEDAQKTSEIRGNLYNAFDRALEEEMWFDDDSVREQYGEVTDETVFQFIADNIDEHGFVENYLVWLSEEMGVEYDPWEL